MQSRLIPEKAEVDRVLNELIVNYANTPLTPELEVLVIKEATNQIASMIKVELAPNFRVTSEPEPITVNMVINVSENKPE